MNKSSLLVRLAVVMIFSSLAVGFISSQLFYRLTYLNEVDNSNEQISELYKTVSATATIAAYLLDRELAKEVVEGLATNGVVHGATLEFGGEVISTKITIKETPITFPLHSPFEEGRIVGHLSMISDPHHIELRAKEIGSGNAKALIAQASIATFIAIFISYLLITQPIAYISRSLHKTTPGTDARLSMPDFHNKSELGELVRDINHLLNNTQQQIKDEQKLKDELELIEKRFRMLFESSQSPIILMEPRGSILLYNHAFIGLLEKLNTDIKKNFGVLLQDLFEDPETLIKKVKVAFAKDEMFTGEFQLTPHKTKKNVWVQVVVSSIISDDMKEYYQFTLHDISKRKKEIDKLSIQANYDQMTQLLNRHGAEKKIQELIYNKENFVVILMDLNGFKTINDVHGHDCGDEILINVAKILKDNVRQNDFPCRWGGDEFVIILKEIDEDRVRAIVKMLLTSIKTPYQLSQYHQQVSVGASIGAAFYPQNSIDMQSLIQMADKAMYQTKSSLAAGKNIEITFASEINV
jgi:diguanylate cyclase (GGDEF)-like protein/PAS domain S-box-containing protein